ncbi:saccharopine dehydrogenase family protein [Actinophytocola sp.]|uniref:saccharopine dehydrogenase family protein n=1 Tax=Actinophytocola sp. TaxID=1872138 RepID=UPI002ED32A4F
MSETSLPPTGTVHWIGTGLSTGPSGLRVLIDNAAKLVLWGRTTDRAEQVLRRFGLSGKAETRAYDPSALAAELRAGDVVISMLPGTEHATLLGLCVEHRAHFACTSYVSDPIAALSHDAEQAGLVVLTEAGLDPGIDHLFADLLVAKAQAAVGDLPVTAEFTSYCGGIPAVANEFRYRFSWAPRGVLNALLAPARYLEDGEERTVDHPWEATHPHAVDNEPFEVYPNRDSIPYISQYAFPPTWRLDRFVRGTLRLEGWHKAWSAVFDELLTGDSARVAALAGDLAARYPTTESDRDRVILTVALNLHADGKPQWSGEYLLDVTGDAEESAMARCVSLPLAYGITQILRQQFPPGLHQAAPTPEAADDWLSFLRTNIPIRSSVD